MTLHTPHSILHTCTLRKDSSPNTPQYQQPPANTFGKKKFREAEWKELGNCQSFCWEKIMVRSLFPSFRVKIICLSLSFSLWMEVSSEMLERKGWTLDTDCTALSIPGTISVLIQRRVGSITGPHSLNLCLVIILDWGIYLT